MKKNQGFTLIEVMIVTAIVAILAAVAIPSYQDSIRKSKRTDAKESLTRIAAAQERFFFSNNRYATTLTELGFTGGVSSDGYYDLAIGPTQCGTAPQYPCFSATATPVAGKAQAADKKCASFSIDQTGKTTSKDSENNDNPDCW